MIILRYFSAALLVAAVASPASAAHFVVDAQRLMVGLVPETLLITPIDAVTLDVGDTVDFTFSFINGSQSFASGASIWTGLLTSDGSGAVTVTSTMTIIDGSANLVTSAGPMQQLNQFVHVGNYFGNSLLQTAPGSISFSGINQMMLLDGSTVGSRTYRQAFFYFDLQPTGGGVPEPASWAMLIAGFGLVGAMARRRRAIAA